VPIGSFYNKKTLLRVPKPSKTPKKWAWLGNFKPKVRKIESDIFNRLNQIDTKFDETLKTISLPWWVVKT